MNLLREIQDAAVRSDVPLTELLRKCRVLGARLSDRDIADWADRELNGYPKAEALPEYRVVPVRSLGHFFGYGGSRLENAPIPPSNLPEKHREFATIAYLRESISAYEDLLRNPDASHFRLPWPADLVKLVASDIYQNMSMGAAWCELGRGAIIQLVETVRNRVLSFALELETQIGSVEGQPSIAQSQLVSQVFHTHVYGNVANYAQGGSDFRQVAVNAVVPGDLASVIAALKELGVPQGDIDDLEHAVADDGPAPRTGLGPRVAQWIGGAVSKVASGAWKVTLNTASSVIPKLIARYYGIEL